MNFKRLLNELMRSYFDEPAPAPKPKPASKPAAKRKPSTVSTRRVSQSSQVYGSQPIIMTGAQFQMQTPPRIRQMRTLSGFGANGARSLESLFVQQGRYMADYTDDFPEMIYCSRSLPMYYNLKDDELRCYFTWRTRYREGMLPQTDGAYLQLYCSELINQIGISTPAEGYEKLNRLYDDYGEIYPHIAKMLTVWLRDYAAYYQLPFQTRDAKQAAVVAVLRHSTQSPAELLTALDTLSKYHILQSRFYAAYPDETAGAVQAAYQQLLLHYAQDKQESLPGILLGGKQRQSYVMFERAVFYQPDAALTRAAYRLDPSCTYHCYGGKWAIERFGGEPDGMRIGAFLRTVDWTLREEMHFKGRLKPGDLPDGEKEVIRRAILGYFEAERRKNAPKIELNEEELRAIREAAEHTTDMLTLPEDETTETPEIEAAAPVSADEGAEPEADTAEPEGLPDLPLSKPALALLLCLLSGESYQPLIDAGQMISVLSDEINEALYEQFGDTVLETDDAGEPVVIEDYREELIHLVSSKR